MLLRLAMIAVLMGSTISGLSQTSTSKAIDAYLRPYVQSNNFSGNVLVQRGGKTIFEKSYGFADRDRHTPNTATTRFHIASLSMQFTAAAALKLIEKGSIRLDEPVSDFVDGIPDADKITIRDLLIERSGLPDANDLPNYDDDILQHHQTPSTLVAAISGKPLLFEPGTKFLHEEHSAYNLLALIIEKKTGMPFAAAMRQLIFSPLGLANTGIDDDSVTNDPPMAKGYGPEGNYGLSPVKAFHWSGKTGNGSAYSTTGDEAKWINAFFADRVITPSMRAAVLDTSIPEAYGWFKRENQRFSQIAYSMNGRSPGFGSYLLYLPREHLTVILLSNIYSAITTTIGNDIAALSLGLPFKPFHFERYTPTAEELRSLTGIFQFGPDFYQPNARLPVIAKDGELTLHWPTGTISYLLPLDRDRFIDRSYWLQVTFQRDPQGKLDTLHYNQFIGKLQTGPD